MIGVIAFILTGVFVPMLILECLDWLPWVADRLIQRAAGHLPLESQARYVEEWKADFIALPGGKLTKLLFGFRVWASSRTTGKVIREEAKIQAEKAQMDMLAVRVLVLAQQVADQRSPTLAAKPTKPSPGRSTTRRKCSSGRTG